MYFIKYFKLYAFKNIKLNIQILDIIFHKFLLTRFEQ